MALVYKTDTKIIIFCKESEVKEQINKQYIDNPDYIMTSYMPCCSSFKDDLKFKESNKFCIIFKKLDLF